MSFGGKERSQDAYTVLLPAPWLSLLPSQRGLLRVVDRRGGWRTANVARPHSGGLLRPGGATVAGRRQPPLPGPAGVVRLPGASLRVQRFWLPELWLGIEDMPDTLAEFYTAPEAFEMAASDVQAWIGTDQYVFHAGCGDF